MEMYEIRLFVITYNYSNVCNNLSTLFYMNSCNYLLLKTKLARITKKNSQNHDQFYNTEHNFIIKEHDSYIALTLNSGNFNLKNGDIRISAVSHSSDVDSDKGAMLPRIHTVSPAY